MLLGRRTSLLGRRTLPGMLVAALLSRALRCVRDGFRWVTAGLFAVMCRFGRSSASRCSAAAKNSRPSCGTGMTSLEERAAPARVPGARFRLPLTWMVALGDANGSSMADDTTLMHGSGSCCHVSNKSPRTVRCTKPTTDRLGEPLPSVDAPDINR